MKTLIIALALASNFSICTSIAHADSLLTEASTSFIARGMGDLYIADHDGYAEAEDQATERALEQCSPLNAIRISDWVYSEPQRLGYSYIVRAEAVFSCED